MYSASHGEEPATAQNIRPPSRNTATYRTALGLVPARQGRLAAGAAEIERAVDLDATDVTAYHHLSDLYRALGRDADADWARSQALYWASRTGTGG